MVLRSKGCEWPPEPRGARCPCCCCCCWAVSPLRASFKPGVLEGCAKSSSKTDAGADDVSDRMALGSAAALAAAAAGAACDAVATPAGECRPDMASTPAPPLLAPAAAPLPNATPMDEELLFARDRRPPDTTCKPDMALRGASGGRPDNAEEAEVTPSAPLLLLAAGAAGCCENGARRTAQDALADVAEPCGPPAADCPACCCCDGGGAKGVLKAGSRLTTGPAAEPTTEDTEGAALIPAAPFPPCPAPAGAVAGSPRL